MLIIYDTSHNHFFSIFDVNVSLDNTYEINIQVNLCTLGYQVSSIFDVNVSLDNTNVVNVLFNPCVFELKI